MACTAQMYQNFDLSLAVGPQLDAIGAIVGAPRALPFQPTGGYSSILGDADYLTLIRAKIAKNQWNGSIGAIYTMWNQLFPGATLTLTDNQDMTVTVSLSGSITSLQQQMIENDLILMRPQGVLYVFGTAETPIFGFSGDGTLIAGFSEGHWAG
jgi:hypothetical protein